MFKEHDPTILEILQDCGAITPERLKTLIAKRDEEETTMAQVVLATESIPRNRFFRLIADFLGYDFVDEMPEEISQEALHSIDPEEARRLAVVPVFLDGSTLTVIPKDPFNFSVIDELGFNLGMDIQVLVSDSDMVVDVLNELYGREQTYEDFLSEIDADAITNMEEGASATELTAMANEGPVVRFVNLVLTQAIKDKASRT